MLVESGGVAYRWIAEMEQLERTLDVEEEIVNWSRRMSGPSRRKKIPADSQVVLHRCNCLENRFICVSKPS